MPRRLTLLFAGLALAACKKSEPKPTPQGTPPAPVVDAAPADAGGLDALPPLTPPIPDGAIGLQVRDLQYEGYAAPGLPAIKSDGSVVIAVAEGDDGGRGYLDLSAHVLDGSGKLVSRLQVTDPNLVDLDGDPDQLNPATETATRATVESINAMFAEGTWRTMRGAVGANPSDGDDDGASVTVEGLTYQLDVRRQVLTIRRGATKVASHKLAGLYKVPRGGGRSDDDGDGCGAEAPYLHSIHVDTETRKILVGIGFVAGGHNCGAAGAVFTVVPLPT